MKVLLVEDDRILGESIKEYLESEGFWVEYVSDSKEVLPLLEVSSYDLIVLDLMMPHVSGEELLREIRKRDKETPILILTAKRGIEDKKTCFLEGADDYLTKPFEPVELLLRLKALYRRRVKNTSVKIGDVEIDLEKEKVLVRGEEISLSKKEWMILKHLVENRGRFVSTEEILNYVWGGVAVGDEVVRAHVKNLRRQLPEGFIISAKGRGYKVEG